MLKKSLFLQKMCQKFCRPAFMNPLKFELFYKLYEHEEQYQ